MFDILLRLSIFLLVSVHSVGLFAKGSTMNCTQDLKAALEQSLDSSKIETAKLKQALQGTRPFEVIKAAAALALRGDRSGIERLKSVRTCTNSQIEYFYAKGGLILLGEPIPSSLLWKRSVFRDREEVILRCLNQMRPRGESSLEDWSKKISGDPYGLWQNGIAPTITLPANASMQDVLSKYFELTSLGSGRVNAFEVMEERSFRIQSEEYRLLRVLADQWRATLLFRHDRSGWWSKQLELRAQADGDPKEEIWVGMLSKKPTVGYRSPYRLRIGDQQIEVRAENREALESLVGQKVEIHGAMVETPAARGAPGSEAASRFIDGMVPAMRYLEVRSIRTR